MTDAKKVLILGAGRLAADVADMIDDLPNMNVIGFVINKPPFEHGTKLLGLPVFWIDELLDLKDSCSAVCAIGSSKRINLIKAVEEMGIPFVSIIHPSARVSRSAIVGEGTIISGGVQVAAQAKIGRHVILNRGALIGPFDVINNYVYIAPGANLTANVTIGSQTWVGLGANILEHLTIGEKCIIGAGSLVTKDVPDCVKAVGMPAMIIERDIQGY